MTLNWQLFLFISCTCFLLRNADGAEKWSRQIEPGGPAESDSSLDWIPLAQPLDTSSATNKDRSENGRVLGYSQSYPSRYSDFPKPQAVPLPAPQTFDFPYQFQGFPNTPLKSSNGRVQEPTSQSFFKFEMPFHKDGHVPSGGSPSLQTGYQIHHNINNDHGQAALYSSHIFSQPQLFNPHYRSGPQKQPLQRKPIQSQQNYIEETLPLKTPYKESKPTQQSIHSVTPQSFPQPQKAESLFNPLAFQPASPYQSSAPIPNSPAENSAPQQEEVQLVYVPYDTFFNKQQQQQSQTAPAQSPSFELNRFGHSSALPDVNPYQINQFYTQDPLAAQRPSYYTTSTTNRPATTSSSNNIFQNYATPQFTTPKPKPKAHQPPLAMFLMRKSSRPSQSDVVASLRNSADIAVIDSPTKNTPNVFVGPAGMPIPEGFVKFDLPYLSQLTQTHNLNEVPFFVAPLSYRAPNGFNKILLPEPHVGSIVVNKAKDNTAYTSQPSYSTVSSLNDYSTTTQRPRAHSQRIKQPSSTKDYYPELLREPNVKNRQQYDSTTQRSTVPSRGNKFSYYVDQDVAPEIMKINKPERPKKKRPQSVQVEQTEYTQTLDHPYQQYSSVANQILNDDYSKQQSSKPPSTTSTSTSTTSTSTSTSTTSAPPTYFPYNSSPQIEFHSSSGQLYPSYNSISNPQNTDSTEYIANRPSSAQSDEDQEMKQFYRQQENYRSRPQNNNPTYSPFEQVQYTPIEVTIPSSTTKPSKQRFTFYSPMETTTSNYAYDTQPPQEITEKQLPGNHRPAYNPNEIPDSNLEYEPNPYQLPSELPPLTANLPGLVNDLQEKNKAAAYETTTPLMEVEMATRPTRRPIHRVRKPVVSKVTSSVSYSESESTVKRPTHRIRRPYGSRGNTDAAEVESTETTTRRAVSGTRSNAVRNPNRIRYQPTTEERQSFRIKSKKQKGSKGSAAEDIDYQRDVLNQNYPVFRPSSSTSRKTTSPTAIPSSYAIMTTEPPTSESQQVYTVTPSSNDQVFPAGMLEPMQIAQQYNRYSKDNYGPGYFPNQEDLNPTEPIRNEINPIYTASTPPSTTTTSTTTEAPQTTTRRSLFVRRNYPRIRPTTTETPITTASAEEKSTTRSRLPLRKVIKVRPRTRRPTTVSSTTTSTEEAEPEPVKNNYRKLNRFNQDLYEQDAPKRRYKTQFHLEGQESRWSPSSQVAANNFSPNDFKEDNTENKHNFENEPEIVTLSPDADDKRSDTYDVKVSADYGPKSDKTKFKAPNLGPEKSFAELLEEVMGKAPVEKPLEDDMDSTTKSTDGSYFESQKTTIGNRINRRGKWKKLRSQATSQQTESLEAAESQNIGEHLLNRLYTDREELLDKIKTTTPLTSTSDLSTHSAVTEYATVNTFDPFATVQTETSTKPMDATSSTSAATEENPTRRLNRETATHADDLDSEPSIFSEVKKQLHDLFAIDDSEDQAATAALAAVKKRHEYTHIKRTRPPLTTTEAAPAQDDTTMMPDSVETTVVPTAANKSDFHKNLMDHLVYATSKSTKVSSETEICYKGRCIRSDDLPTNHKLQ